jgi:hypothetical protein
MAGFLGASHSCNFDRRCPENIVNRNGDGLFLADEHDQLLAAGDADMEQDCVAAWRSGAS